MTVRRVTFFPQLPHDKYIVHKICAHRAWDMSDDLARADRLVVAFCDRTRRERLPELDAVGPEILVVNRDAVDIGKTRVDAAFASAFGFPSLLDARTYAGDCVAKSEANARRDGHVVRCPIESADPEMVYQRLVDNRDAKGDYVDLRAPVFWGSIPFVYVCRRPEERRFSGPNDACSVVGPEDVLSRAELEKIARLCRHLAFDYGELDVVRERRDGGIFVLDANHTPYGPPTGLPAGEKARAVALLADAFERAFLP